MSEHAPRLEPERQLGEHRADSERQPGFQFTMIQRGDFIKSGYWHWRCRYEDSAGDVAYGYVHADPLGRAVAPETFERDPL